MKLLHLSFWMVLWILAHKQESSLCDDSWATFREWLMMVFIRQWEEEGVTYVTPPPSTYKAHLYMGADVPQSLSWIPLAPKWQCDPGWPGLSCCICSPCIASRSLISYCRFQCLLPNLIPGQMRLSFWGSKAFLYYLFNSCDISLHFTMLNA